MLLGNDYGRVDGQMKSLISASARNSDHFEELKDRKVNPDHLRSTIDALIEGGYLQSVEKNWRGKDEEQKVYQALTITQKGRDALAGGVGLPAQTEVKA